MLQCKWILNVALIVGCLSQVAQAADAITVSMANVAATGPGAAVGTVTLTQTEYGLLLTPQLTGLTPGVHGMHIHQDPSCDNFGQAAQGHFDPNKHEKHLGPYNNTGHLGDLPALTVDESGKATLPVLAPQLTLQTVMGHSLMIHAGGDNYSDNPKLGGGGDRIVCGIIPIEPPK